MHMFKKLSASAFALVLATSAAFAGGGGNWNGFPILGNSGYCSSYVNGVCVNTVSPGESSVTGNEMLPADTWLPGGQAPQTELVPLSVLSQRGQGASRNVLIGTDFLTNLWQRGTTFSSLTPTTSTMTADRWAVYSSGNTTTISQDTTTADVAPIIGVNGAMKVVRPTGTNTSAICVGQVLPQKDSARFAQGNLNAIFSFYANPLSGYLASNKDVVATIAVYTAGDSATPGTNTDAFMKGTVGGYTVVATSTIPLVTGWTRYSVAGVVPNTVSGTQITGIGITLCTPVYPASTGVATDGFLFGNAQLEDSTAPVVNTIRLGDSTPGNSLPGAYARRVVADETAEQLSYSYIITDGATTRRYGSGFAQSTALAELYVQYPVEMRETPVLTVGTTISFGVRFSTASTQACGTSIAAIATSGTPVGSALLCTTGATALTANAGLTFAGANTGGLLTFSAEP